MRAQAADLKFKLARTYLKFGEPTVHHLGSHWTFAVADFARLDLRVNLYLKLADIQACEAHGERGGAEGTIHNTHTSQR